MKNGETKNKGCNGKGKVTILLKMKGNKQPAKIYTQCVGCDRCKQ